jgi:hypothetical protein
MITSSPPRFALRPSRVIDASSHLLFRAAGIPGSLLAVSGAAPVHAGKAKLANPQAPLGSCWRVRPAWSVAPRSTDTWAAQATRPSRAQALLHLL